MMQTHNASPLSSNASVHASAGSGKTYLLVSRIVRLLLLDVTPANILAITFTRKAAAEMHNRLMERLFELSSLSDQQLTEALQQLELPVTPALKQNAQQLFENLLHTTRHIKVTTFHAFCQELLRRFPMEADVPPGFELEDKTAMLRKTAWHALMTEASANRDGITANSLQLLLKYVSPLQMATLLERFLMHRSDWWAYTQGHDDPVGHAQQQLMEQLAYQANQDPVSDFFRLHSAEVQRYAELLSRHPNPTNLKILDNLADALNIDNPDITQRLSSLMQALFTSTNEPRKQKTSKTLVNKLGEQGADEFLALHHKLTAQLEHTQQLLATEQLLAFNQAWLTAGQAYLTHYQSIKNEQRLLDFSDLEWKTYKLLNHPDNASWIQYKLDERIEHLLIDEFQDTNPTQWHLILPLLEELAAGNAERQRSVFLVGDAKQSIYRFRRANAELFNQASEWLAQSLQAQRFTLNKSWRSSPAIMQFVNKVFSEADDFDFSLHDTHHQDLYGQVCLLPVICEPDEDEARDEKNTLRNPLLRPRPEKENRRFLLEGQQVAATITKLIAEKTPVRDGDNYRPLCYHDILVLFRTRTHIQYFEQALRQAGIPYLGADRGTLLESLEVNDMLNLLQWLITPYDNQMLAGILKSPLFSFTDAHLLQLAQHEEKDWLMALYELAPHAEAGSPLQRAAVLLKRWLLLAGHIPVHDLLDKVYSQANVIKCYQAAFPAHLSSRVQANLTRFIELALEIDSGRYPSLTRFTTWINELKQQTDDAPDAPSETASSDRITLMTIHAAKGLEAPVVFLADSSYENRERNANSVIVDWPASLPQPAHFLLAYKTDFTPDFIQQCFQKERRLAQREDINLLYVAVTRARQYLYISGSQPQRGESLGWYGRILEHYQLATDDVTDIETIEHANARPDIIESPLAQPTAASQLEGLAGPFNLRPRYREIAPSRTSMLQEQQVASDEDARQRGIIIHTMLEQLSDSPGLSLQQLNLNLPARNEDAELDECWQEARQVVSNADFSELFDSSCYQQAYNEVPVIYQDGNSTVHGIIDRLIVYNDHIKIIDYKTHRHASRDTLPQLVNQYQAQMQLYARGIQHLWPEQKIEASLLFTHCCCLQAVPLDI